MARDGVDSADSAGPDKALLLQAIDLDIAYGAIHAVQGVSVGVDRGSVSILIGANGAGKSSVLNAIAGLVPSRGGRITFDGREITHFSAVRRVRELGLVLVPEGRSVFKAMTVDENLEMGSRIARSAAGQPGRVAMSLDGVFSMFPNLRDRRRQTAQQLSGGEQQMLAIARAMLMGPRVLLVDEPSMGLAPVIVRRIFDALADACRSTGTAILVSEQDVNLALKLASYVYLLQNGRVVAQGRAQDLEQAPELQAAYFGRNPGGSTRMTGDHA